MSGTHFKGPVTSAQGFVSSSGGITVGSTAISEADIGVLDAVTPGTAVASKAVVLDSSKGIATITSATITTMTGNVTGNVTGYVVGKVNASQSTISAAAGASNTATVTVQLKDGAGTNLANSTPFKVYASSAADGLTIASAASTGFSVASGGLELPNENSSVTQGISCVSSATGGCVLSLLDTGKQTSYLVLVISDGTKISAQLSSGSYGA